MSKPESVAVFCASSQPRQDSWADRARSFGVRLAQEGISLVYGGGARGLMGQVAQGCHEAGGRVTGVLPTIFDRPDVRLKVVHSELEIVPGMHERKARMYGLADAFVALRTTALLMHPAVPFGCEKICEHMGFSPELFFSWEHAFDGPAELAAAGGETPAEHKIVPLPPRYDFFEKHPSQVKGK